MKRRTLLKTVAAIVVARPVAGFGQAPTFTDHHIATLNAIAEVALPAEAGVDAHKRAVAAFVAWFANYKPGADMGHGYGAATLRAPSDPSPASRYPAQFAALDAAATARGASTFRSLEPADRRAVIEAFLNEPQPVNRLPDRPTGANLIADFMGSYFTSADAWDICYRAQIRRDSCRTLDDSASAPAPIRGR